MWRWADNSNVDYAFSSEELQHSLQFFDTQDPDKPSTYQILCTLLRGQPFLSSHNITQIVGNSKKLS